MRVWIVGAFEPIAALDSAREMRCGMLAHALSESGHNVLWWTTDFDHSRKVHRFHLDTRCCLRPGVELQLLSGPAYRAHASPVRLLHHRVLARKFAKLSALERRPDVIFACLPPIELAESAESYALANNVPFVLDIRDQWPDVYLSVLPQRLRRLGRLALTTEFARARRTIRRATHVGAVSETFLSWAKSLAAGEGQFDFGVYPLGYPRHAVTRSGSAPQETLASLLDGWAEKGADIVVKMGARGRTCDVKTVLQAATLAASEPKQASWRFLVVGADESTLRQTSHLKLRNIATTGWLDHSGVSYVLQRATVGLAAYVPGMQPILPNKAFEYLAFGLPIVSSLQGELEGLIAREGIGAHYPAGDPQALVNALASVLRDAEVLRRTKQRVKNLFDRRFAEDVVYPGIVQRLEEIART